MGTWGYGIYDNDTFCEVLESFREMVQSGVSVEDVVTKIQERYENEIDECVALLAIAESLWRTGKLTAVDIKKIQDIAESGADYNYWIQHDADKEFLRNRSVALDDFIARLSRNPTEKERWKINQNERELDKGGCFWYRYHKKIYGAVILERVERAVNYSLIILSEELSSIPQTVSQLLEAPVYTIAWFGDASMLKAKYIHVIGSINISGDYKNKWGIKTENEKSIYITNCGQAKTWAHSFRTIKLEKTSIENFLSNKYLV